MKRTDKKRIDLEKLQPETRARVERALKPRHSMLSLKFNGEDIESWREAAAASGKHITEWVEAACNEKRDGH